MCEDSLIIDEALLIALDFQYLNVHLFLELPRLIGRILRLSRRVPLESFLLQLLTHKTDCLERSVMRIVAERTGRVEHIVGALEA
jgi:hypothetical protein